MKIISDFKDYYDSIQVYGAEEHIVYDRTQQRVKIDSLTGFKEVYKPFVDYGQTFTLNKKEGNYYDDRIIYTGIIIGFCGQLNVGHKFDKIEKGKSVSSKVYYTQELSEQYLASLVKEYHTQDFRLNRISLNTKDYGEWFHLLKAPVFVFPWYAHKASEMNLSWDENIPEKPLELVINPNLKNLNFQLVKDAYSCHQEIQQFISGFLSVKDDKPRPLTDKEHIAKSGIDPAYGFRMPPKKKDN